MTPPSPGAPTRTREPASRGFRPPLGMVFANLALVAVLAVMIVLYAGLRTVIVLDALLSTAALVVGVAVAMTVWVLRLPAR